MDNQFKRPDRRLPRLVVLMLITGLMIFPATVAAAPRPAANCENIDAIAEGFAYPIFDDDDINLIGFKIEGTALGGTVTGTNWVVKITPGGTIHFAGKLSFEDTVYGKFETTDEGVVTNRGRLNTTLTVFEGGSGFIMSHGTIYLDDPDTLTYVWEVHERGRICIAPSS